MKIKGITDISGIEWRDHNSTVIFFHGCPLECKYCQNHGEFYYDTTIEKIAEKLEFNKNFVDSVVVSGGEPYMQYSDLCDILKVSKEKGLKTAVETSGYFPESLKDSVKKGLLDKVFLDLKGSKCVTGVKESLKHSILSLEYLSDGLVELEVRTTAFKTFPDMDALSNIMSAYPNVEWVLQQGVPENAKDLPQSEYLSQRDLLLLGKKYGIKRIRSRYGEYVF